MMPRDVLSRLARESASGLAELGVRASDEAWIAGHARMIAGLGVVRSHRARWREALYRLARRAARTAR